MKTPTSSKRYLSIAQHSAIKLWLGSRHMAPTCYTELKLLLNTAVKDITGY